MEMKNTAQISYDMYKEGRLTHSNELLSKVLQTKNAVDCIFSRLGCINEFEAIFQRLENFGKIYDALVLNSSNCISIYDGTIMPKLLNPAFLELIGYKDDDERLFKELSGPDGNMLTRFYESLHRLKVVRYTGLLNRGIIAGYKNVDFTITRCDAAGNKEHETLYWSNFSIPDTKINIRFGVKPYAGMQEEVFIKRSNDGKLYQTKDKDVEFADLDAMQRKENSLDINYEYSESVKNSHDSLRLNGVVAQDAAVMGNIGKVFDNYRLMAMALDIMFDLGPIPAGVYLETGQYAGKPTRLSNEFLRLSGYAMKEVLDYYAIHKEVGSLFYKGPHLEYVKKRINQLKACDGYDGYVDENFTMTSKDGDEITIAWNSFIHKSGSKDSGNMTRFSVRSGRVIDIKKKVS